MTQELDQAVLAELKEKLLAKQAEIKTLLAGVADKDTGDHVPGEYAAKFPNFGDDNPDDPGSDSPDEVQAYQENLALTGNLEQHLHSVEAALQRMEDGTYGKDVNTGEAISMERLQVNPEAETAIHKS